MGLLYLFAFCNLPTSPEGRVHPPNSHTYTAPPLPPSLTLSPLQGGKRRMGLRYLLAFCNLHMTLDGKVQEGRPRLLTALPTEDDVCQWEGDEGPQAGEGSQGPEALAASQLCPTRPSSPAAMLPLPSATPFQAAPPSSPPPAICTIAQLLSMRTSLPSAPLRFSNPAPSLAAALRSHQSDSDHSDTSRASNSDISDISTITSSDSSRTFHSSSASGSIYSGFDRGGEEGGRGGGVRRRSRRLLAKGGRRTVWGEEDAWGPLEEEEMDPEFTPEDDDEEWSGGRAGGRGYTGDAVPSSGIRRHGAVRRSPWADGVGPHVKAQRQHEAYVILVVSGITTG